MWLIAKLKVKLDESECIPDVMIPHKKYIASLKLMSFSMRGTANMVTKNREKEEKNVMCLHIGRFTIR